MPAIQSGKVSEATINEKIRHILDTAAMFDAEDNRIALQSAREAPVLLKNEGNVLPLKKQNIKTVLVVGPDAYPGAPVGGGSAGVVPFHTISLLEGLSLVAENVTVFYDAGLPTLTDLADHTNFMTAARGGRPGLTEEIFANRDLSGTPIRQLATQHMNNAGFDWNVNPAAVEESLGTQLARSSNGYSRRYTGFYNAATGGNYLLALAAGREGTGNRVYVDDKLVIDDWKYVRALEPHLTLPLSAGMHKIVLEAWQRGWGGGRCA